MSLASSAVTYTSVYIDSESEKVFCGAEEEISDEGSPRVIVYGYDGLPMLPPHDMDFIPEPIYHEYIPLEDKHILPAEEQPLPPIVLPTTESLRYVAESDPEEYEDDETEDGPVNYPMDGGDDGDDDDGDSSGYDADDEDVEEEKEHLASADSTTSISLPPEAEVERLLAIPTPPPSPLTSLSPPSTGERLARCTTPAALPSPPLPPSLYPPPPVDRRDDIPESEQPPRKRLYLSTLGSRYERVGYGIMDAWIDPAEAVPEMEPTTLEKVNTRVTELVELHEHDTQDLYALLEDARDGLEAYAMTWEVLKKKMTDKYYPQGELNKLDIELWNLKVNGNDVPTYTNLFQKLTLICTKFVANENKKIDKYISRLPDIIYGNNVAKVYNMGTGERKPYEGSLPKCTKRQCHHNGPCTQKCHKCNKVGHFARDCKSSGNTNVANTQRE
nr:hypothetical protein [Tanacetum cinerariifolium]